MLSLFDLNTRAAEKLEIKKTKTNKQSELRDVGDRWKQTFEE